MGKHWDNLYDSDQTPWAGIPPWLEQWVKTFAPSNKVALDLGCGAGDKSLWLAKQGYQVTGVDISEVGIQRAEKARGSGTNPQFIHGDLADVTALSLTPKSFGLILDILSSQFLSATDQKSFWKQLETLLIPDGAIIHARLEATGSDAPEWVQKLPLSRTDFEASVSTVTVKKHATAQSKSLESTTVHRYVLTY